MNKKKLIIWIPVTVVLANLVVYLIVAKVRAPSPPVATGALAVGEPAREAADDTAKERERDREEKALARKVTGVAALDAGDYDRALIAFAEARDLLGDKAHVGELLKVTEDLRRRSRSTPSPAASRPALAPAPPRPAAARSGVRRLAAREREQPAVEVPAPALAPPAPGLLIVTTIPRGLLVHVDEAPIDLTPMRASLKRGPHRVTLLDGSKKIYETTVEVKDGAVTTLVRDFSAELGPEPARAPAPAPEPAPAASVARVQEEAPRPSAAAAPPPAPRAPRAPPSSSPPPPRSPTSRTGSVAVSSPGLYGVVWINGRPRGYPPLEAGDLPPGPIKVEVRVNGVERRSSTVVVRPGSTTPVKLLSLETAP